jgi:cytochrome c peroxidase
MTMRHRHLATLAQLVARAASDADRLRQAQSLFARLPPDMASPDAPIAPQRVELGRMLFFDPRLTIEAKLSCSSCHQ